ncbi:hypothetical protein PUNSTDRAFT_55169 [Punctularia strigosozonata HHB-11173 SS5]|uniref:Casein kinase substrate phosphoprotein PP28 domain-containing protein n=1 Tax=Punctularia strigosozonata (strain HHB-11173) TaxID=741275 RepID=R7S4Z0_PUNST|nr:uncharacterized protein PUNSTDRAFT_55169 [Punctularia strigosozonata HHB-11173 SS5]EIN05308.1 hypothetical protein PUNSTDRAFT_55169 [Punctularia strigosozonata HHB-11173 SS5]
MVRGTGKFKQKRGGGRSFSKNLVLDENGTAVSADQRWRKKEDGSDEESEEEEEEEEEEESEEEEEDAAASGPQQELSRAERRALKAQQKKKPAVVKEEGEEDGDDPLEANLNRAAGRSLKLSEIDQPRELTRREREAKEKKDAQDKYWKLHEQGKTDQAKADLARLAKIRADREQAAAKRKAEAEAKAAEVEAKKKAQLQGKRI